MTGARRLETSTGWIALALWIILCALSLVCIWRLGNESVAASLSGLRLTAKLLTLVGWATVVLLLGVFFLIRRQREENRLMECALNEKSAELQTQTATASTLAREVETARAQLQKLHDVLEERVLERTADLKVSTTALDREKTENKQAGVSLRQSESNLVIAHHLLERGVADHTRELLRSNHELEQFAYVASHDLQEPLRAITGCVQILEKRYGAQLDARGHELIGHAVEGSARLKELIEGLLTYSRVSRYGYVPLPVSAHEALNAALQQLESAIKETGAVVVEEGELPMVCADHGQLVQLLQNLIGNAIKYRRAEAPRIDIAAERNEANFVFSVRDNGIGIESRYFHRVFSIFQRLHTRDEYPGTGIGLAICRRIVEQAGGSMWIESVPGTGSTFYFTLPAA